MRHLIGRVGRATATHADGRPIRGQSGRSCGSRSRDVDQRVPDRAVERRRPRWTIRDPKVTRVPAKYSASSRLSASLAAVAPPRRRRIAPRIRRISVGSCPSDRGTRRGAADVVGDRGPSRRAACRSGVRTSGGACSATPGLPVSAPPLTVLSGSCRAVTTRGRRRAPGGDGLGHLAMLLARTAEGGPLATRSGPVFSAGDDVAVARIMASKPIRATSAGSSFSSGRPSVHHVGRAKNPFGCARHQAGDGHAGVLDLVAQGDENDR